MSAFLQSSIGKKIMMALSALFLLLFLLQHLIINFTSVVSEHTFNEVSHFMGTNLLIQFLLQPILIAGVVFHFVMGFVLELKNRAARTTRYARYLGNASSSWVSRNMLLTGLVILAFLTLHFIDFWLPELNYKYIQINPENPMRYYPELTEKFHSPLRVGVYSLSFVLLSLHLWHGFTSAFQSVGFNNRYSPALKKIGRAYAILVPLGFIFIALFHHFNSH